MDGPERTDDMRAFGAEEDALLEAGNVDGATDLNVRFWVGPDADDEARELVWAMQKRAFDVQIAAGDVDNEEWEVGGITAPVKLFTGAHEPQYFAACADHLVETLPDAEHTVLPWAYHLPSLERPTEMTALLRTALS